MNNTLSGTKLLFLGITLFTGVHAEILVVKQTPAGLTPLNDTDLPNQKKLADITLNYQWPMVTANTRLTPAEKKELFTPGTARAEERFIDKKMHAVNPDYRAVFIPTTLYELFALNEFYKLPISLKELSENPDKVGSLNPLQKAAIKMLLTPVVNRTEYSDSMTLNESIDNAWADVLQESEQHNKFPTAHAALGHIYNGYRTLDALFYKDNSAFLFINNRLLAWLLEQYPELKNQSPEQFSDTLEKHAKHSADTLIAKLRSTVITFAATNNIELTEDDSSSDTSDSNYDSDDESDDQEATDAFNIGHVLKNIDDGLQLLHQLDNTFVYQVIVLEYEARTVNKALLLRGSSPNEQTFAATPNKSENDEPASVVQESNTGTDPLLFVMSSLKRDPRKNRLSPYSISFGNSLFAAIVADKGACVYSYLTQYKKNEYGAGFSLLIDKEQYSIDQNDNLFFIAPLSPLTALFASGLFFHSRSKSAVASKAAQTFDVEAQAIGQINDPYGLTIITRNPLLHAARMSRFFITNGKMIHAHTPATQQPIAENQEKLALVYKLVSSISNWWAKKSTNNSLPTRQFISLSKFHIYHSDIREYLTALIFNQTGTQLIAGYSKGAIIRYDLQTNAVLQTFSTGAKSVIALAVNKNDSILFVKTGEGTLSTWDLASGKQLTVFAEKTLSADSMVLNPDATLVHMVNNNETIIFNRNTGAVIQKLPNTAFSDDGTLQAISSGWPITIKISNRLTTQPMSEITLENNIYPSTLSFSPDNTKLAIKYYNTQKSSYLIAFYNAQTGADLATIAVPNHVHYAFSHDSSQLIAFASQNNNDVLLIFDVITGKLLQKITDDPVTFAVSPTGNIAVATYNDQVTLYSYAELPLSPEELAASTPEQKLLLQLLSALRPTEAHAKKRAVHFAELYPLRTEKALAIFRTYKKEAQEALKKRFNLILEEPPADPKEPLEALARALQALQASA